MANQLKKAAAWLGLVADERYLDDNGDDQLTESVDFDGSSEPTGNVSNLSERLPERRVHRSSGSATTEQTGPIVVKNVPSRVADMSRIVTVHPRTYNEAKTIGEHFRDGVPVIMNLSDMEDADAKRLVDFAAGLIFGLHGTIERVTSKVFLLSPNNVTVAAEDKERIAGSFFNQS